VLLVYGYRHAPSASERSSEPECRLHDREGDCHRDDAGSGYGYLGNDDFKETALVVYYFNLGDGFGMPTCWVCR
jgi:hypothetical protein